MEKKKKKPVGLIVLLISLLVIGGFIYYQTVYVPSQYEAKDVEIPIETKMIWNNPYLHDVELLKDMASAMEKSDAKFFIGENDEDIANFEYINQTDMDTYNATVHRPANEAVQVFDSNMSYFLNTNYSKMPDKETFYWGKQLSGSNTMFGDQGIRCVDIGGNNPNMYNVDKTFGTNIYDYFMEHELVISCDNIEITKICGGNVDEASISVGIGEQYIEQTVSYVFVGYADVTTENAIGDLSDIGIFGNPGETVRVRIIANGIDYGLCEVYLERVD